MTIPRSMKDEYSLLISSANGLFSMRVELSLVIEQLTIQSSFFNDKSSLFPHRTFFALWENNLHLKTIRQVCLGSSKNGPLSMKDEHSLVLLHRLLITRSSENSPSRQGQFPSLSPKTIQHSKKIEISSKTSRLVLPNFSLEQSSLKDKWKLNPFSSRKVL